MNIDKRALKGVVDEIEASRARQKGETEFQREALKRAVKNHQLDAKAIRIVLQRRAMGESKRDEQDYYVHSYEIALGGKKDALEALEKGATIREAAKAGGISTGSAAALAKGVQESSFVNSETGEITETAAGDRLGEEFQPDATGSSLSSKSCGGGEGPAQPAMRGEAEASGESDGAVAAVSPQASVEPGPQEPLCRECEGTGIIVYFDGRKIHGHEPCPVCKPRVASDEIVCVVDDGKPCPNTCAREGRCVWSAGTGSATRSGDGLCDALSPDGRPCQKPDSHSTGDARAQYQQHLETVRNTPDDAWERVGEMPAGLRRVRA